MAAAIRGAVLIAFIVAGSGVELERGKVGSGVGIDMWKESRYERCLSGGLKMLLRGVKRVIESSSAIVRLPEK